MRHLILAVFAVALLLTAAHADDWSKIYNVEHAPQLRVDTSDADIRLDTRQLEQQLAPLLVAQRLFERPCQITHSTLIGVGGHEPC